jgi:hypothetical protein
MIHTESTAWVERDGKLSAVTNATGPCKYFVSTADLDAVRALFKHFAAELQRPVLFITREIQKPEGGR